MAVARTGRLIPGSHGGRHAATRRRLRRTKQHIAVHGHHGVVARVHGYGHGFFALFHVQDQVEAARADFGQLTQHDILGDTF